MNAQEMLTAEYKCAYPCDPPCLYIGDAHHMFVPAKGMKTLEDIPPKAICPRHRKLMEKINWRMRHETVSHTIKKMCAKTGAKQPIFVPPVRADVLARIDPSRRNKVSSYREKGRR